MWHRLGFLIVGLWLAPRSFGGELPCGEPSWLDPEKSLLIRDLSVVDDGRALDSGPWSFKAVMSAALGFPRDAGPRTYRWIDQFHSVAELNGYRLHQRNPGNLLENWPRRDDPPGRVSGGTDLDLARAPFRLLAIALRTDIPRKAAGEMRFAYGVMLPDGVRAMTVIFEFNLPTGVTDLDGTLVTRAYWQEASARLSLLPFGEEFNRRLQALTELVVGQTGRRPTLSQVRTNEQYFGPGWDLREFRVDPLSRELVQVPVADTPDLSLDTREENELTDWIIENRETILAGDYELPARFLGGSAFLDSDRFAWFLGSRSIDPDLRRAFALKTCNGCHGRETRTRFLHVEPRLPGQVAVLSDFARRDLGRRAALLKSQVCGE